jgi:hypothetical protein
MFTDMTLHTALEDPAQPEILTLLRAGEEHSAQLYPAESNHHLALVTTGARSQPGRLYCMVRGAS